MTNKDLPVSDDKLLKSEQIEHLMTQLETGWKVIEEHHLEKIFLVENFKEALWLANAIGDVAANFNHHPDLFLSWGKVKVTIWTHKINGLSLKDFSFAAQCDELFANRLAPF